MQSALGVESYETCCFIYHEGMFLVPHTPSRWAMLWGISVLFLYKNCRDIVLSHFISPMSHWISKKVLLGFPYHLTETAEWTLWPTHYLLTADLHWPLSPSCILFTFPKLVFLLMYSFIVSKDCCIVTVYIFGGYLKPFLVNVGYELLRK